MNHKGASVILMLFEILVVAIVLFFAFQLVTTLAQSDTVIKVNTAQDLAMMVNALAAVPGDAVVEYPHDLAEFSLILTSGSVIVQKTEQDAHVEQFLLPANYSAEGVAQQVSRACLEKKESRIRLRECQTHES